MNPLGNLSVVIVAGGKGYRTGAEIPKQFIPIAGKPMLMHTVETFYNYSKSIRIILVLPQDYISLWRQVCRDHNFTLKHIIVKGGETRFHSVKNGLKEVSPDEIVAVHDGARPFASVKLINRCYKETYDSQCGVIPVVDEVNSIRKITGDGSEIINRTDIKIVQTPQVFPGSLLKSAYEAKYDPSFTDDASVAERNGVTIKLICGEDTNLKITTSFDMELSDHIFKYLSKR